MEVSANVLEKKCETCPTDIKDQSFGRGLSLNSIRGLTMDDGADEVNVKDGVDVNQVEDDCNAQEAQSAQPGHDLYKRADGLTCIDGNSMWCRHLDDRRATFLGRRVVESDGAWGSWSRHVGDVMHDWLPAVQCFQKHEAEALLPYCLYRAEHT